MTCRDDSLTSRIASQRRVFTPILVFVRTHRKQTSTLLPGVLDTCACHTRPPDIVGQGRRIANTLSSKRRFDCFLTSPVAVCIFFPTVAPCFLVRPRIVCYVFGHVIRHSPSLFLGSKSSLFHVLSSNPIFPRPFTAL